MGDYKGHVKQYRKTQKSNFFGLLIDSDLFALLKDYGNIGVGQVLESFQNGRLAFFVGNTDSVVAINISKQRVCTEVLNESFEDTEFLRLSDYLNSEVYLSNEGQNWKYSSDVSGNLNVTQLYNGNQNKSKRNPSEINKVGTLHSRKRQIH